MTGPSVIITSGLDDAAVLPLDGRITTTPAEPGLIALGWAGDRLVTLDLTGAPAGWLDGLTRAVWQQRARLAWAQTEVTP